MPETRASEGEERCEVYLHFEDMTWPNPNDPSEIEWRLRYGTPTRSDLLLVASFMGAYRHLVGLPVRTRNKRISSLRSKLSDTEEAG